MIHHLRPEAFCLFDIDGKAKNYIFIEFSTTK